MGMALEGGERGMDGKVKGRVPKLASSCRGQSDSSENSRSVLSSAAALHYSGIQ